jgi:nucleoside-diphosphate-sugar epimerase
MPTDFAIDTAHPVAVTGANGYVASWIVQELLDAGCTVHATVRDPSNSRKVEHLQSLAATRPGTLRLFAADLLTEGSFDEALEGCKIVLHTASPFVVRGIKDAQSELIDPAVQGTENVLRSVDRCNSVQRVVLTSSVVAIYGDVADAQGQTLDESQWNTSSSVEHQPYPRSKVAAEQAAWAMAEAQSRWDLVVINPGLVLGPALTRHSASESLVIMGDLLKGKLRTGVPQLEIALVDVRDVAHAHVRAAFIAQAQGRHVLVNQTLTMLQMAELIGQRFQGRFRLPKMELPKWLIWLAGPTQGISRKFVSLNVGHTLRIDNGKSRQALGLEYRPIADTLAAHVQQMLDDGIVRG